MCLDYSNIGLLILKKMTENVADPSNTCGYDVVMKKIKIKNCTFQVLIHADLPLILFTILLQGMG